MTLYARRNTAALGEYYVRHIEAVTDEDLCDASDIAAELAWRDREIERLRATLDAAGALADWINRARPTITELMEAYVRLNRSYWTGDAIDRVQPWRCMEYIAAEDLLRDQPVAVVDITAKGTIPKSADANADDDVQAESVRINSMEAPPKYQSIPTPPGRPNGSLPAMSLSKRELIAAMAMQGLCAAITGYNGPSRLLDVEGMAQDAIGAADALLKELAK